MSEQDADFVMTLSSELISEVVQQYFKTLFKKPVQIVDLMPAPNGDGYAFSVAFVRPIIIEGVQPKTQELEYEEVHTGVEVPRYHHYAETPRSESMYTQEDVRIPALNGDDNIRDKKGRFTKKAKVE